jgi:dihydroorotase
MVGLTLMDSLTLDRPLDMHLHFRQEDMLRRVAPLSAASWSGGVIMPNLVPPVDSLARLRDYRREVAEALGDALFQPYFTLFFRPYTEQELRDARPLILGVKLYPAGATTHSEAGVRDVSAVDETFDLLQDLGIPLLVHGETHGFVLDREEEFLPTYRRLATRFPRLRITMEHITTAAAVRLLDDFPNLFATVTLQHLLITLDDVAGGLLDPHLFCKPIAKRPEDREALLEAALAAHPKLMFGSDSAPHPVSKKECAGCAAGCFTAPIALPLLAELFDQHGCLDNLQAFVSDRARTIYGVNPPARQVCLERQPFTIPARYGDVVPFRAGREVSWRLAGVAS